MPWKRIDLTGKNFGRWTVIDEAAISSWKVIKWNCVCSCGNKGIVQSGALKNGSSRSCGCLLSEKMKKRATTHGKYGTPLYMVYIGAKGRCTNPKNKAYANYGGRGIKFNFASFPEFESTVTPLLMVARELYPNKRVSLDRIDSNGNYEKGNLRYTTYKEQSRNMRTNRMLTFNGKTLCAKEWSEILGINYATLQWRIHNGWSTEKSLSL